MDYKARHAELVALTAESLDQKIERAHHLINQILTTYHHPALAFSGGMDSTVMLHLVLQHNPQITVIFNNTRVEFPETIRFIRQLQRDWRLHLHTAKSTTWTFWKCVEVYGWPIAGKRVADRVACVRRGTIGSQGGQPPRQMEQALADADVHMSARCCYHLKEAPSRLLCRHLQVDCLFIGLRTEEGRQRKLVYIKKGNHYLYVNDSTGRCLPLATWTRDDITAYHNLHHLPINPLYTIGYNGTGCWPCAMDIRFPNSHLSQLRKYHPKLWHFLIYDAGLGDELLKAKLALTQDDDLPPDLTTDILQRRPCFLDQL